MDNQIRPGDKFECLRTDIAAEPAIPKGAILEVIGAADGHYDAWCQGRRVNTAVSNGHFYKRLPRETTQTPSVKVGDKLTDTKRQLRTGMRIDLGGFEYLIEGRRETGDGWYVRAKAGSRYSLYDNTDNVTILALPESDSQKVTESVTTDAVFGTAKAMGNFPVPGKIYEMSAGPSVTFDPNTYRIQITRAEARPTSIEWVKPNEPARPEPKPSDPWAVHLAEEAKIAARMVSANHGAYLSHHCDRRATREWLRSGGSYEPGRNGMGARVGGIWRLR